MKQKLSDIEARTQLAGSNKFELLLFRLGASPNSGHREFFGINVFKVREVLRMPEITEVAHAHAHLMGMATIRGQIIPVIDLPAVMGCRSEKGLGILMVTEYGRTVQAFAVEDVHEIVRLDWNQVVPVEGHQARRLVTGLARVDGDNPDTRLAQVLDVEQILRDVIPPPDGEVTPEVMGDVITLPPGSRILVAEDSSVARTVIEHGLKTMGLPYIFFTTGKQAWTHLSEIADACEASGQRAHDQISLVLTDVEMPEMDGFTLTKYIKDDPRLQDIPVIIHSSLTGTTNESHVRKVGADAFVGKFSPKEFAAAIRKVLT